MKKEMTREEIEKRFAEIEQRGAVELTEDERKSLEAAEAMDDGIELPLEDVKRSIEEYSGRLVLRIPKELHRNLADDAKRNGVSLNQYMIYKLAK